MRKTFLTFLLLLIAFTQVLAKELNPDDFYVVEMIIFTNKAEKYFEEETWPRDINLSFAEGKKAFLTDADRYQIFPGLDELFVAAEEPLDGQLETATTDTPNKAIKEIDVENTHEEPVFYPRLPEKFREQNEAAKKIRITTSRHKLLMHDSWLQYIESKDNAIPIVLSLKTDEESEHPYDLAGTITIYKERYLHIKTNLWHVRYKESAFEPIDMNIEVSGTNIETTVETSQLMIDDSLSQPWPLLPEVEIVEYSKLTKAPEELDDKTEPDLESDILEDELTLEDIPLPYNIQVIAKIDQKRKMRSREIHYIDHPLVGIMLEIRPYSSYLD